MSDTLIPKPPKRNIELEMCFLLKAKKTFRVSVAINPPETDPDVLGGSLPTTALEVIETYGREVYDQIVQQLHYDEAVANIQEIARNSPPDTPIGIEIKEKEEIMPTHLWVIDTVSPIIEPGVVGAPFVDYVNLCKKCGHDHSKEKTLPPIPLLNQLAKDLGFSSYTKEKVDEDNEFDEINDVNRENRNGVAELIAELFGGGDSGLAVLKIDEDGKLSQLRAGKSDGATPGTKIFSADD